MSPFCRALLSLPSKLFPYVALLSRSLQSSLSVFSLCRPFVALSSEFFITTPFCRALLGLPSEHLLSSYDTLLSRSLLGLPERFSYVAILSLSPLNS